MDNSPDCDKPTSHPSSFATEGLMSSFRVLAGVSATTVQWGYRHVYAEREAAACAGSESLDAHGLGERRLHDVGGPGESVPYAQGDAHGAHVLDVRPVVETHTVVPDGLASYAVL